jgi:diguanylate cyclase (GGDEF)-like protein
VANSDELAPGVVKRLKVFAKYFDLEVMIFEGTTSDANTRGALRRQRVAFVVFALTVAGLMGRSLWLPTDLGVLDTAVDVWLFNAAHIFAGLFVVFVGRSTDERKSWCFIGASMVVWSLGNVLWQVFYSGVAVVTSPSVMDALWLGSYPLLFLGISSLMKRRLGRIPRTGFFDGAAAGFACAALGATVAWPKLTQTSKTSDVVTALHLVYPVFDVVLMGLVVGMCTAFGWSVLRGIAPMIVGLGIVLIADVMYYVHAMSDITDTRGWDTLWLLGLTVTAATPLLQRSSKQGANLRFGSAVPALSGFSSLGVLVLGNFVDIGPIGVALATASIVLAIVRVAMTFHFHQSLLEEQRDEASTDALTLLGNRRRLHADLVARSVNASAASLIMIDLDDLKSYNDSHGHVAGDELLAQFASLLREHLGGMGEVYRLGGDEFCAVLDPDGDELLVVGSALEHLTSACHAVGIAFSFGTVRLFEDSKSPRESMAVADERLYAHKRIRKLQKIDSGFSGLSHSRNYSASSHDPQFRQNDESPAQRPVLTVVRKEA